MQSRDFYRAIASMRKLAIEERLLTDDGLGDTEHNLSARILRHGMSVTAFAMLEKHLQALFDAFMSDISAGPIAHSEMSIPFKAFCMVDSLLGLQNKMNFYRRPEHKLAFLEERFESLLGLASNPPRYNGYSFSPKGTNVTAEDVKTAFLALGVSDPWRKLTALTSRIGNARTNLEDDFKNLAKTRHSSAHNPTGNIPSQDLLTNIIVAGVVGAVVGAMLQSLRASYLQARSAESLLNAAKDPTVEFRFIDRSTRNRWIERTRNGGVLRRFSTLEDAVNSARRRRGTHVITSRDSDLTLIAIY